MLRKRLTMYPCIRVLFETTRWAYEEDERTGFNKYLSSGLGKRTIRNKHNVSNGLQSLGNYRILCRW
jgi:hypothetical protein